MATRAPMTEEVLNLVELIYGSATDPAGMPLVLRAFNELVEGTSSQIYTRDLRTGTVSNSQISDTSAMSARAHAQYISYWGARDPRAALLASLPAGRVLRCQEEFGNEFVSSSEFYQDFFIPHGFRWALGGTFGIGDGTATVIANVRAADLPPFEDWTAAVLGQLLPHFERASLIRSQLARAAAVGSTAAHLMKHLPMPCLLTDAMGRCIEGNEAFTSSTSPLSLGLARGRIRFSHPERQQQWERALLETEVTALGRSIEMTDATGLPFRVHLIPWRSVVREADAAGRKMILAVFDERRGSEVLPNPSDFADSAGLTRAEFEVMRGLLQGLPAKAIANQRGASVNTVRSQITAILEKTGHSSQKELIASFGASGFGSSTFGRAAVLRSGGSALSQ
jgi:DNA-binding CsgD family transcriptional regulator